MEIKNYQDIIKHLNKEKRTKNLLLGNGFSISYDKKIFSYNALSNFLNETNDPILTKLFSVINTSNFELIMNQLDVFYKLAKDFISDETLTEKILIASDKLKSSLINAISILHPEHVYSIPTEKSNSCALFLKDYIDSNGHIFTTNYDLLLYWVLMNNQNVLSSFSDGFGKEYIGQEDNFSDSQPVFGDTEWGPNQSEQNIHYLHGALHLFDAGISIIKETYGQNYLLDNIRKRINKKQYPIFVTAGDGNQKLEHISHNQYLNYCYKRLSTISGSLITFGFSFGKYDDHIIAAINKAAKQNIKEKLWSIYIGVFSEDDKNYIESIMDKFIIQKAYIFDAKTVNIWDNELKIES
jgi:hypothetical protein